MKPDELRTEIEPCAKLGSMVSFALTELSGHALTEWKVKDLNIG